MTGPAELDSRTARASRHGFTAAQEAAAKAFADTIVAGREDLTEAAADASSLVGYILALVCREIGARDPEITATQILRICLDTLPPTAGAHLLMLRSDALASVRGDAA